MFGTKSGARCFAASTGITLFSALACGSAPDTAFYKLPLPPDGSASSAALEGSGGNANLGGSAPSGAGGTGTQSSAGMNGVLASSGGTPAAAGTSSVDAQAGTAAGSALTSSGGSRPATAAGGEAGSVDTLLGGAAGELGEAGASSTPVPVVDCTPHDPLAQPFDGHCYLANPSIATFADAVADCAGRGAHLVTISSDGRTVAQFLGENSFVWQLGGAVESWIGATDGKGPHQPGDGTFSTWITGEPMTFDNWSSGQPNNARSSCQEGIPCSCEQGACYEHCGFQWDTPGSQMNAVPGWNDRVCDHQLPYVCEWDD
jgi:hypothetical protein